MIFVSSIGLCFTLYLLLTDFSFYNNSNLIPSRYETVAVTRDTQSNVRKRAAHLPVWDKVTEGGSVQSRDQVFTDAGASTVLEFTDGSRIKLGENTLIRVEKGAEKTQFDVVRGDFVAEGSEGGIPVEINVQGIKTVLSGKKSSIQVSTNAQGATSITVVKGNAQITSKGKTVEVGANQEGQFAKDGSLTALKKIPFVLLTPEDNQEVFVEARGASGVEFSWEAVQGVSAFQLEVASDSRFKRVVQKKTVDIPLAFLQLPSGKFYWRVSALQAGSKHRDFSVTRQLGVHENRAPRLALPAPGARVAYRETLDTASEEKVGALVKFSWEALRGEGYEFELTQQDAEPFLRKSVDPYAIVSSLTEGAYQWRVRVFDPKRPLSPWSEARTLNVEKVPLPRVLASRSDQEFALNANRKTVRLEWQESSLAKGYQWEVSKEEDFEKVLESVPTKRSVKEWVPQEVGKFYWRVRPVDLYGRQTVASEPRAVSITTEPPSLLKPSSDNSLSLPDLQGKINFSWSPVALAENYTVQVAKEKSFSSPLWEGETTDLRSVWNVPSAGKYYWRVLAKVKGTSEALLSPIREIDVIDVPLPDAPVLSPEYEIDIEGKKDEPSLKLQRHSWLRLIISDAYAAMPTKTKQVTRIQWKSTGAGNSYYLELADDPDFENVLVKKKMSSPEFLWSTVQPGRFYLRVASIDKYNRRSDFSNTSVLLVRPRPPKLSEPRGKFTYREKDGQKLRFSWARTKGATDYLFEASTEKDFSKPVLQTQVKETKVIVEPFENGKYFWRVKARLAENLETRFSDAQPFSVAMLDPLPPPPPEFDVTLQWKALPKAQKYNVEIGTNKLFSKVLHSASLAGERLQTRLPEGTYYWRVAGVAQGKQGAWSSPTLMQVPMTTDELVPAVSALENESSTDDDPSSLEEEEAKSVASAMGPERGPASGGGASKLEDALPSNRTPLYLWVAYAPSLNSFNQASNDPTTRFSGPNFMGVAAGVWYEWEPDRWAASVRYLGQTRTLFEDGGVGVDQGAISTFRHDAQVTAAYGLKADPFTFDVELGYRYMNVLSFRTATSTSLRTVVSHTHGLMAAVQGHWQFTPPLRLSARLGYSYPLLTSGAVTLSSPFNLLAELTASYELFSDFLVTASYTLQMNQYAYQDDDDPLTGGPVIGTLSDNNHYFSLSLGYRLSL